MSLEIILTSNTSVPYWEDARAIRIGAVDPYGWESLFFKDFGVKSFTKYASEGENAEAYVVYYSRRMSSLEKHYPLVLRMRDYYEDAFFENSEMESLLSELHSLRQSVTREESNRFLDQISKACELAIQDRASLQLIAD
jgi:hypothetical protein